MPQWRQDLQEVVGIIRRRRNMSKRLVFFDLEEERCDGSNTVGGQEAVEDSGDRKTPNSLLQLVCEWPETHTEVSKSIVAGMRVRAKGEWDARGRWSVYPGQLIVLADIRGDSPWENANIAKMVRQQHQPLLNADEWKNRSIQRKFDKLEKKRVAEEVYVASTLSSVSSSSISNNANIDNTKRTVTERRHGHGGTKCSASGGMGRARNTGEGHEHEDGGQAGSHGLLDKSKHNLVFTRWLVQTFGRDRLRGGYNCCSDSDDRGCGSGVCDIAGGRGLIGLELALTYDIPAVLIEPKPFRPNSSYKKRIKKWQKKRLEKDLDAERHFSPDAEGDIIGVQHDMPTSCSKVASTSSTSSSAVGEHLLPVPLVHLQEEFHGIGRSRCCNSSSDNSSSNCSSNCSCDSSSNSSEAVVKAVVASAVLVAMHPDQATGDVLQAALQLDKPFAIVPCCVFSRIFQDRLTPSGQVVQTYEELCDWIQEQGGGKIQRATLPFHGRNVVLYRL